MTYLWIVLTTLQLDARQKNPNILVIFGDDIGYWNISAYNKGMTHYRILNIDRLARGPLNFAGREL